MYKRLLLISAIIVCFLLSACGSPSNPAGSPAASNTQVSNTSVSSPASSSSAAASTAAPKKAASSAFKYYTAVDLGMSKDEAEQKLGLTGKQDTDDPVPQEGDTAYYYLDNNGEGIFVIFSKDLKLTSKTVQYSDPAAALVPYTSKAVTKDECDKITDGMAHADIDKLLGSKGAECSKTQITLSGKTVVGTIYRWGNPDGSFIQVPFNSDDTASMAMYFD